MELTVKRLSDEDGWRDMVRIPHEFRKDINNDHISRGRVVRITVNDKSGYVVVRGYEPKQDEMHTGVILIDLTWRGKLKVKADKNYDFKLEKVGWWAEWLWIWRANDPLIRIPAQISLISFFLGILALLLAIPPSVDWIKGAFKRQSSVSAATSPGSQAPGSTEPERH